MKKAFQALILCSAIALQLFTPALGGMSSLLSTNTEKQFTLGASVAHAQQVSEASSSPSNCGWSDKMGCVANFFYNLFVYIFGWLASIAGTIFDYFLFFTIDSNTYSKNNEVIEAGWGIVRDIVNIFFVVGLLIAAISLLFHIGETSGPKILVNVIIAALLVNFSLFFVRVIIDAGNISGLIFYNKLQASAVEDIETEGEPIKSISSILLDKINPQKLLAQYTGTDTPTGMTPAQTMRLSIVFGITNLIIIIVFVSVCMFFLSRVIALWFSMIFAPFAIVSKAIPFLNSEKLKFLNFNSWLSNLLGNSFLVGVFMFFIYIVGLMSDQLLQFTVATNSADNFVATTLQVMIPWALICSFLWVAKTVSKAMAGEFGEMVTTAVGWMAAVAVGGAALTALGAGAALKGVGGIASSFGGVGKKIGSGFKTAGEIANPFKWKKSTNPYIRGAGKLAGGLGSATQWAAGKTLGINPSMLGKAAGLGALGGAGLGKQWGNIKKSAWEDEKHHREEALEHKNRDERINQEKAELAAKEKEEELKKSGLLLSGQQAVMQDENAATWKKKADADIDNAMKSGALTSPAEVADYIKRYKQGDQTLEVYDESGNVINGAHPPQEGEVKNTAETNSAQLYKTADNMLYTQGSSPETYSDARDAAKANIVNGRNFDGFGSEDAWRTAQQQGITAPGGQPNAQNARFAKTNDVNTIKMAQELRKKGKPEKDPPTEQEIQLAYKQYQTAHNESQKTRALLGDILTAVNATLPQAQRLGDIMELNNTQIKDFVRNSKQNNDIRNLTQQLGLGQYAQATSYHQLEAGIASLENAASQRTLTTAEIANLLQMQRDKKALDTHYTSMENAHANLNTQEKTKIDSKKVFTKTS